MPQQDLTYLKKMSSRERELFDILVEQKTATLSEILDHMEEPPTRQAVRALLTIMERKKYIHHEKVGRHFEFRPAVSGNAVARVMFRDLVGKIFKNNLKDALASHLEDEEVEYSKEEMKEIAALFEKSSKTPK